MSRCLCNGSGFKCSRQARGDEFALCPECADDTAPFGCAACEPEPAPAKAPALGRALRYNAGKPELFYAFMFPAVLEGLANVYTYGTNRPVNPYPRYNFSDGAPTTELFSCALRHQTKFFSGEDMDPDAIAAGFNVHHLDSAIGNLARIRQQIADGRTDLDDRPCVILRERAAARAAQEIADAQHAINTGPYSDMGPVMRRHGSGPPCGTHNVIRCQVCT